MVKGRIPEYFSSVSLWINENVSVVFSKEAVTRYCEKKCLLISSNQSVFSVISLLLVVADPWAFVATIVGRVNAPWYSVSRLLGFS